MDRHDFRIWLERHRLCFPAIDDWLFRARGRLSARARSERILEAWHGVLIDTDRRGAVAASIALFNGEEPVPNRFSEHPYHVRDIAARHARQTARAAGSAARAAGSVQCELCGDRGYVFVWHHDDVKRLARELAESPGGTTSGEGSPRVRSTVIYCACQRNVLRAVSTPVYTPIRWCLYEEGRLDRLVEWIRGSQSPRAKPRDASGRRRKEPGRAKRRRRRVAPPATLCRTAS